MRCVLGCVVEARGQSRRKRVIALRSCITKLRKGGSEDQAAEDWSKPGHQLLCVVSQASTSRGWSLTKSRWIKFSANVAASQAAILPKPSNYVFSGEASAVLQCRKQTQVNRSSGVVFPSGWMWYDPRFIFYSVILQATFALELLYIQLAATTFTFPTSSQGLYCGTAEY